MTEQPLQPKWLLGIDGGGSTCRATIATPDGTILGQASSGPANAFQDLEGTLANLQSATLQALQNAGLPHSQIHHCVAGIGLAGLNIPNRLAAIERWPHPFAAAHFCHDLHIACLGAHGDALGAVIVIGTGSCGYRPDPSAPLLLGGHGFPHGDLSGGACLGRQAIERVLLALDGLAEPTLMTPAVLATAQATNSLELVSALAAATAADYGRYAQAVLTAAAQEDPAAIAIIAIASRYLQSMIDRLIESQVTPQVALLGGLASHAQHWLPPQYQAYLCPPQGDAEQGALQLAQRTWRQHFPMEPTS